MKEISGAFVDDPDFNEAVRVLKLDQCSEVLAEVDDIHVAQGAERETQASERTVDEFVQALVE